MKLAVAMSAAVLACALVIAAPAEAATGSFQRTQNVNGPVDLQIVNGSGAVSVHAGAANAVVIRAEVKVDDNYFSSAEAQKVLNDIQQNPPIHQQGNAIRIDKARDHVSISYDITTPAQTKLMAHTGSGSVTVDGLKASADLTTGSGHIRVTDVPADLRAHTGSGGIEASGVNGNLDAQTGSGSVHVTNSTVKRAFVQTGSGGVQISRVVGALEVKTGSGSISAEGEQKGEWRLSSGSGGVRLTLPKNAAYDIDAHTGSGGIHVSQPVTATAFAQDGVKTGNAVSKRQLTGKVNGGGPLLHIRTGSGSIHVD